MEIFEQIITWLKFIDKEILLFINGMNNPFLDELMWLLTGKFIWFPMYLFLFYLVYRKTTLKQFILFAAIGIAFVGLSDLIATHGLKYNIARYRPSHNIDLQGLLHFYEIKPGDLYKGGQYGFVSGHATNSFMIAIYFSLFLRQFYKKIMLLMIIWALVVCYTRVYLGVHYPSDIIGGISLGMTLAIISNWLYRKFSIKL